MVFKKRNVNIEELKLVLVIYGNLIFIKVYLSV